MGRQAAGRQVAGRQVREVALEALLKASTHLAVDHRSKFRSATGLQLRRAQELSGDPR